MQVLLIIPRVDDKLGSFLRKVIETNLKKHKFVRKHDINKFKKNDRDAGHRISEWGCTKTIIFNGNQQKKHKKHKSGSDQP